MLVKIRRNERLINVNLLLVSHRGGKGFGPENTMDSLLGAVEFGVEMVETDIRMTSDRIPIVHHGPFIGLHLLSNMNISEVRDKAPEVPTLEEYLEAAADKCRFNLEIKKCDPDVLAEAIKRIPTANIPLVSSFDVDFLKAFSSLEGTAEIGLLSRYDISDDHIIEEALSYGASTILPASYLIGEDLVGKAHDAQMKVITWTVNNTSQLADLIEAGVDGIITDHYPELREWLETEEVELGGDSWPVQDERPSSSIV
jgi:glycerophosphoryl diester phosphodiesterase